MAWEGAGRGEEEREGRGREGRGERGGDRSKNSGDIGLQ